jgi:NADPH:quinone reductase-like Zn-dependent oxidoreductase
MKRFLKWTLGLVIIVGAAWFAYAWVTSTNDCERYSAVPANPMKAVIFCDYGPSNLKFQDIEKPSPGDDQVLVKVRAASVNPLDWHYIEGTPYVMRAMGVGLRKPKEVRCGVDFSGVVETVGKNVTQFKTGDEVFGGKTGAFAEYVAVRADRAIALKPADVSFEDAAAVPIAGLTALEAVRDKGSVQPGQTVLINGASGGVGTFAVQIAKSFGANVTGVCSTKNLELVKSLGADEVIDYTKEDFTKSGRIYDVILDNVGNHSLTEFRHVLKPEGKYVLIGGGGVNDQGFAGILGRPLKAMVMSWFVKQKMGMMFANLDQKNLAAFGELMQSGKVKAVIDRKYPLSETAAAIRYLEEGHARGKVVIKVGDEKG